MKKQLLRLGVACLSLTLAVNVSAQKTGVQFAKVSGEAPVIDGDMSEWADVQALTLDAKWLSGLEGEQNVSMTDDVMPTVKALWDEENFYVLVIVPDDDFYPHREAGGNDYQTDKPELYFDVNEVLVVDGTPAGPNSSGNGHYQFAPTIGKEASPDFEYSYNADFEEDGDYSAYFTEYKIPFASLIDEDENAYDGSRNIGFDVTVIDLDDEGTSGGGITETESQRINFSNDMNVAGESWVDMDAAAEVELVDEISSVKQTVSKVNVLSTNLVVNGTLEFNTEVSNIQVINTVGQVVSTSNNVSNLTNGVYVVVVNANGETVANRFVKK